MNLGDLVNPSTSVGAFVIGIGSGIVSGGIVGFFTGKHVTNRRIYKNKTEGGNSPIIINSKVEVKK